MTAGNAAIKNESSPDSVSWRRSWPLGWLYLTATNDGLSQLRIGRSSEPIGDALDAFLDDDDRTADKFANSSASKIVEACNNALDGYMDGDHDAFINVPVDLSGSTTFQRRILETLRDVKAGDLVTYAALGMMAGTPTGARAVGGAVGSNPLLIAIPCHRVVAANGSLGGFSSGLGVKRWLLAHEGVAARPGGWDSRRRPVS